MDWHMPNVKGIDWQMPIVSPLPNYTRRESPIQQRKPRAGRGLLEAPISVGLRPADLCRCALNVPNSQRTGEYRF